MSQINTEIRLAVEGVIARQCHIRLQSVYAGLQRELGIAGDIAPWEIEALENAEQHLSNVVGHWLAGSLSFDQAEAMGMDGTLRS